MTVRNYWVCAALLAVSAVARAAAPSFTSIEIPLPAQATQYVSAAGINGHGDIVAVFGESCCNGNPFVYYHASGAEVVLNGFNAGGINDSGHVSGTVVNSEPQAVLWSKNGGVQSLPSESLSMANTVSNSGYVTGNIDNGHADDLAVMWSPQPTLHMTVIGALWDNPGLPGYASSDALGVNNAGHVTGSSLAGEGTDPDTARMFGIHAFLYRSGKLLDLGALALANDGSDFSEGTAINSADAIVGDSSTAFPLLNSQGQACPGCGVARHAFLWRTGKMQDLGNLAAVSGWESKADSVNDSGEIVGWSDSNVNGSSTHRAFLYSGGQLLNLQFYVSNRDPDVRLTEAVGINCQGWIVANGFNTRTPTVNRIYLLVRSGPSRSQCPK